VFYLKTVYNYLMSWPVNIDQNVIITSDPQCVEYLYDPPPHPAPVLDSEAILTELKKRLSEEESIKIQTFVQENFEKWKAQGKEEFIHPSDQLPRSIQYNPKDHSVYVHFNRRRVGDESIGEGFYKQVTLTFHYQTGTWDARAVVILSTSNREKNYNKNRFVSEPKELRNEANTHIALNREENIIPTFSILKYRGAEGRVKVAFIYQLANESLKKYLAGPQRPLSEISDLAHQIILGLTRMHSKHIYHRDLNPKNILLALDPMTERRTAFLADFGLADSNPWHRSEDVAQLGEVLASLFCHLTEAPPRIATILLVRWLKEMKDSTTILEQSLAYFEKRLLPLFSMDAKVVIESKDDSQSKK